MNLSPRFMVLASGLQTFNVATNVSHTGADPQAPQPATTLLGVVAKWRPPLALVVFCVVLVLISLPILGLLAARTTSNQFIHETENSLHTQAGILSQAFALEYRRLTASMQQDMSQMYPPPKPLSPELASFYNQPIHPPAALLTQPGRRLLPAPQAIAIAEAYPGAPPSHPVYDVIGERMRTLGLNAQKTSLAGYTFLDPMGRIISSTQSVEGSLAHLSEVERALSGLMTSQIRQRRGGARWYPARSLSRDTDYRVFVAHPVIVDRAVVGAIYAVRTPNNLRKFLLQERNTIFIVGGFVLLTALLVGYLLQRLLTSPIEALRRQSKQIQQDGRVPVDSIKHYGTHELAQLGESLLQMSDSLQARAHSLETYTAHVTHELKSPLTSIAGAVELLQDNGDTMSTDQRQRFLANISQDADRMTQLLDAMRRFSAVSHHRQRGETWLEDIRDTVEAELGDGLKLSWQITLEQPISLSEDDCRILLVQLLKNAQEHGADACTVQWALDDLGPGKPILRVRDNGSGIADGAQIFEPFYTTKRDQGGTGMGLSIVRTMLVHNGATIEAGNWYTENQGQRMIAGAEFKIIFD